MTRRPTSAITVYDCETAINRVVFVAELIALSIRSTGTSPPDVLQNQDLLGLRLLPRERRGAASWLSGLARSSSGNAMGACSIC